MKNMAKTLNLMSIHKINSKNELYDILKRENMILTNIASDIKSIENNIENMSLKIKNIENYNRLEPLYSRYINSEDKINFHKAYSKELILFEASEEFLKDMDTKDLEDLPMMRTDLQNEINRKNKSYHIYQKQKEKVSQLIFLKSNLETYMQWKEPDIHGKREH